MYYPVETRITAKTSIRRERMLPTRGQVLVNLGETVGPADVVARCLLPGEIQIVNASQALRVPRERVAHIWIDRYDRISINDNLLDTTQIEAVIYGKLVENPSLIVAFNVDKQTRFEIVNSVMDALKQANATRVSFTADPESK